MITILGSINLDLIATSPRLPAPGETILGTGFLAAPGGKGANQALAARRAGADVRMAGAVGEDDFAAAATALLRAGGIDLMQVGTVAAPTGIAAILVDAAGENMITVVPGANAMVSPADAERAVAAAAAGDILVLQLELPLATVARALELARGRGVTTILNLAPATAEALPLARAADILIANRIEWALLAGAGADTAADPGPALLRLHRETGQTIVVTLGADGVVAVRDGRVTRAAGLAIDPVDTVGAGDTFCGYFAAALDEGRDFAGALARAAAAGSLACLTAGAQTAIPERAALEAALARRSQAAVSMPRSPSLR